MEGWEFEPWRGHNHCGSQTRVYDISIDVLQDEILICVHKNACKYLLDSLLVIVTPLNFNPSIGLELRPGAVVK